MVSVCDSHLHQSFHAAGLAGSWKLAPGRALSLHPRTEGTLRILAGRAWVTLDERPRGHNDESGDHVLQAGQKLVVRAGSHLVFESMDQDPIHFDWHPHYVPRLTPSLRWQQSVVLPLRDLRRGAWLTVTALARLLWGLVGYADYLVAGRGRAMSPREVSPP